jgi:hypothetical protein
MKRNILKLACLAVAVLLAACSSEDMVGEGKKVDVSKGITFQFSEERFLPGTFSGATRAAMQPQVVDLGNGMEAEMTLEPDSSCMGNTRAGDTPISDGHYMIYAIKTEDGQRYDGLKGEVKNGKFIPDTPSPWYLEPGKEYTFVCWSNDVADNGTDIEVHTGNNAMVGTTVHTVANDDEDVVPFVMKHLSARVRLQFNTYTAPMKDAEITSFNSDSDPEARRKFDLKGNYISGEYGPSSGFVGKFDVSPDYTPSDKVITYKNILKNYAYYLDGSNMRVLSYFPFYFSTSSTIYGKPVNDVEQMVTSWAPAYRAVLQKNHSYTFKINIRPSVLYLFSDGTVGTLGDKGTRTPIGVVVKEKTSDTDKGLAIALNNAADGVNYVEALNDYSLPFKLTDDDYIFKFTTDGYDYTHNTNVYDESRYANMAANKHVQQSPKLPAKDLKDLTTHSYLLPAYHNAATYNPGVATQNIGEWFLPSGLQWRKALSVLGKIAPTTLDNAYGDNSQNYFFDPSFEPYDTQTFFSMDLSKWSKVFTDAGGTFPTGWYNMSSGGEPGNRVHFLLFRPTQVCLLWSQEANFEVAHVRPFVYY